MLYRIGLDIGIGSVGWAVLQNDSETEDPVGIVKLGVRTFAPNEVADTGESTAAGRREKRGQRRRRRRKELRFDEAKSIFKSCLNYEYDPIKLSQEPCDIYELRARALDSKIEKKDLARIYFSMLKHRGFKSNRKNLSSSKEEGKLLSAIKNNSEFMHEKGYRTIGEAFYKDTKYFDVFTDKNGKVQRHYKTRNHAGNYENCFYRADLSHELELISKKQQEYYKELTDNVVSNLLKIFERQRNFDEGPGDGSPYSAHFAVGNCTFLKDEKRAPKASFTFEYFSALSKINNLKVDDEKLSEEQVSKLAEAAKAKEKLSFDQVRKLLAIDDNKLFNLCKYNTKKKKKDEDTEKSKEDERKDAEKTTFVSLEKSRKIAIALGQKNAFQIADKVDEIALMLSTCKSDSTIDDYIKNSTILHDLSKDQIDAVKALNFDKFGSLSVKAMRKIIPFLEKGQRYDTACKSAGFNHSSFEHEKHKYLKGDFVDEAMKDVTSNVVKRSINQTLRIVNEIIKQYGSPQYVTIELARDIALNLKDRKNIERKQAENAERNDKAVQEITEKFGISKPSGQDILKYRLYMEQECKCMYSGKTIEFSRLFEPNYLQIDHILPYSRSFDDSFSNKVLVLSGENQNKANRTPYEAFGKDEQKWTGLCARASLLQNTKKRKNLLREKFDDNQQKEYIERNLNDTRYMSRFLLNLFQDYLRMTPSKKYTKVVRSINGATTSYLRKVWGINKLREDGDIHHCIDAAVIAVATEGQVQKIASFSKNKELFVRDDKTNNVVNKLTGEVLPDSSKILPTPYPTFTKELALRTKAKYKSFEWDEEEIKAFEEIGYNQEEIAKAKPVIVSRMKTTKPTGAIHKETIMSTREYAKSKNLVKSVSICKLKLSNKPEEIELKDDPLPNCSIENYYHPEDDRLLYLKLKQYLHENGKIEPTIEFHKPKSDRTDGPVVKTIKMYEKSANFVQIGRGGAANDRMYRVDVFKKGKAYFLCPVYRADIYAKKLPQKVIAIGKDWIDIDNSFEFQFSLYQNDLIKVKSKRQMKLSKTFTNPKSQKDDEISNDEWLVYYNGTGIATASITIKSHDNCYVLPSLGAKNLLSIEKYYINIMGKIYKAPKEERQEL